jgi:serpin B
MMTRLIAGIACVLLATGATTPPPGASPAAIPLDGSYSQFGFSALRELRAEQPGSNIFISPTSVAIALAMVANGAEGSTRSAILQTLGAQNETIDALNAANQTLIARLGESQAVQLSIANALWLQQGFPLKPAFREALGTSYGAQADNLDFRSAGAPAVVNAWAAKHTHDRIQKIVDTIDSSTIIMLANAVAFKGKWTLPFDPKSTQPHDFTTAAGVVRKVPMMQNAAEYAYANRGGIQAIRLPYADGTFAMYVVLPQDAGAMQSFLSNLTPDTFADLRSSLESKRGTIELPRFTITFAARLNGMLAKLGMGIAFGRAANFDGIHPAPPPLQISEVRHASYLKVDEEGTEAAAVTTVGVVALAIRANVAPFTMIVDRPFFLAIRDEHSGQILFTGTIADPGA